MYLVGVIAVFGSMRSTAAATITGITSPYLQTSDSPLATASPGYRLEDFEPSSPTLPLLGVNLTTAHGSSVDPGLSVDGDDGAVDGSGAAGHSLTVITQASTTGATFTFNNVSIGAYPKSAAVAVTAEFASLLTFTVYNTSNAVSGTYNLPNVSTSTPTSDDFLFWASDPAGIGAISVTSNSAAIALHLDHLQYDTLNTIAVPEPATIVIAALGLAGVLAFTIRRRRRSTAV
jgi:MYXO-CTERM domain-containing protein